MRLSQLYKQAQEKRLAKAIELAGSRYTPKLSVVVNIASVFDGLGRTTAFFDALKRPGREIVKNLRSLNNEDFSKIADPELEQAKALCLELAKLVWSIPHRGAAPIDFKGISDRASKARRLLSECVHKVSTAESLQKKQTSEKLANDGTKKHFQSSSYEDRYGNERHCIYQINGALYSLLDLSGSETAQAANNPLLLLNGVPGSGKTHFLCDLAKHRIDQGLPSYIFLGEEIATKDPLTMLKALLGVDLSNDNFLAKVDQYAAAKGVRALIIVDAVNESLAKPIWGRFNKVKQYPNVGVVLSVRSGFEKSELPNSILQNYVRVEHQGFAEHEWEATTKFFAEYQLPLPEVPILFPEFRIPLFLKIFCESFAGSSKSIKGHYGFTHIFEQYVKNQGVLLLRRMGEVANLGESRRRVWDGTIKALALYMGEKGVDRIPDDVAAAIATKQFPKRGDEALGFFERSWLITKVPRYNNVDLVGFDYRFPYQKFSDHLVVRNLLEKHLDAAEPRKSFSRGTILHNIIATPSANRGLIEALSIQIPERLRGRELVYVAPRRFRLSELAKDAFLESLVWRDLSLKRGKPKYIRRRRVLSFINRHIAPYVGGHDKVLETILTVSAIPNHPLNARLLHNHLRKNKMPERDAFWLPFVNSRFDGDGAVSRLVSWGWNGGDKQHISHESIRLAGITLAWFLASSNRFLRDRATKALVSIFSSRLSEFGDVLEVFRDIDDPYIAERLYAVAYGIVLQPGRVKEDVCGLAVRVYKNVFGKRRPPNHLLLREYARGVIEEALALVPELKDKVDKTSVRPPYGSTFPKRAPSLSSLRQRYYPKRISRKPRKDDYWEIWHSLMYNNEGGIADFGNYVVNSTISQWCDLRMNSDGSRPKTLKELHSEFQSRLNGAQMKKCEELESMRRSVDMQKALLRLSSGRDTSDRQAILASEVSRALGQWEHEESVFVAGLDSDSQRLYREGVLPYRDNPRGTHELDYAAIQRLVFKRVIDLGWNPKLFAKYDSSLREAGRDRRKIERIGKKYQWIAFHETLGLIADNYVFRGYWSDDVVPYDWAWQISERNIDPSCLLCKSPVDSASVNSWWCSYSYKEWRPSVGHSAWTAITTDLPDQKKLVDVKARGGWIVLDGLFRWQQPPTPGEERFDKTTRDIWYIVRGYLMRRKDGDSAFAWAQQQDFMGRWMPDPARLENLYLREFPYALPYATQSPTGVAPRWQSIRGKKGESTGLQLISTTEEYSWEGSGFDCSVDDGIQIKLPAKELVDGMQLVQSRNPGEFSDRAGNLVALDPSVGESGHPALLVRKNHLLAFLKEKDYEILWAVLGEKLLIGGLGGGDGFPGRLEMGGALRMKGDGILEGASYSKVLPPRAVT